MAFSDWFCDSMNLSSTSDGFHGFLFGPVMSCGVFRRMEHDHPVMSAIQRLLMSRPDFRGHAQIVVMCHRNEQTKYKSTCWALNYRPFLALPSPSVCARPASRTPQVMCMHWFQPTISSNPRSSLGVLRSNTDVDSFAWYVQCFARNGD